MKIGAKVEIFNYNMREARKKLSMTQADLAESVGISIPNIQAIETIKKPSIAADRIIEILTKISDILAVDFDFLFPENYLYALQEKILPTERNLVFVRDIDILCLPENNKNLLLQSPDEIIEKEQMIEAVRNITESLPPREKKIMQLRYGLNGDEPQTLEQVAKRMDTTKERVRQIEATAFMRMRRDKKTWIALNEYRID